MKLSAEQLDQINHNYFQGIGTCYSYGSHDSFLDAHDYNVFDSGDPQDQEYNWVNAKTEPHTASAVVDPWEQHFRSLAAKFRVVLSPWLERPYLSILEARGYQRVGSMPGMVLRDIAPKVEQGLDDSLRIEKVVTPAGFADFLAVMQSSYDYEIPSDEAKWSLTQLPNCELSVAYLDRQAAAISMSYITGDVLGIYWVGTKEGLPQARPGRCRDLANRQAGRGSGLHPGLTAGLEARRTRLHEDGIRNRDPVQPLQLARFLSSRT